MAGGVVAEGLEKRYGDFTARDGIDFVVAPGTVAGLLGPDGAGKTTTIGILTTLLQPDGGHASGAGYDVVTQAHQVRSSIALTGQYAAVDDDLTGTENLMTLGVLGRLSRGGARARAGLGDWLPLPPRAPARRRCPVRGGGFRNGVDRLLRLGRTHREGPGDGADVVLVPVLPVVFTGSAFAPISKLPHFMQPVARYNPVTAAVDLSRGLAIGGPLLAAFVHFVLWTAAITVVFTTLGVRKFRQG